MRRIFLVVILILVLFTPVSARSLQEVIPLSSSMYADMDLLYRLTGMGTPSNARPWTVGEAILIHSRIDKAVLSGSALKLHEQIQKNLDKGLRFSFSDGFQFDTSADVNLEMYAHGNGEDFHTDRDWVYGFEDRKPLLKLNFSFAMKDYFYLFTDLQYGRNRFTDRDTRVSVGASPIGSIIDTTGNATNPGEYITHSWAYSQPFLTNILWPTYDIDFQTPKRAIASVGGDGWNFNLSRDRIKWGNGHSGNFIIDDHVDYQEFARFNVYSNFFKYEWLNVFFETNPSSNELVSQDTEFRILMAHRLEFRILDRITFAISENIMYRNDVFSLRHVNPAFIYHNLNNTSMFNAIAHAELDVAFGKGFNAYAQYVLDQAVAPNEPPVQADAFGWLVGLEYAAPMGTGILSSSLEYATTSPALYRRDGMDFLMFRRYATNGAGFLSHVDYIGYQYGGDAQVLQMDVAYRLPTWGRVGLRFLGMRHGQVDYFTPNSEVNSIGLVESTPTGSEVAETGVVSLSAEVAMPERMLTFMEIEVWGRLDLVGKRTYVKASDTVEPHYKDHTGDVQLTVGISCAF